MTTNLLEQLIKNNIEANNKLNGSARKHLQAPALDIVAPTGGYIVEFYFDYHDYEYTPNPSEYWITPKIVFIGRKGRARYKQTYQVGTLMQNLHSMEELIEATDKLITEIRTNGLDNALIKDLKGDMKKQGYQLN